METETAVEWLVVGAGVHGTYIARELRGAGVPADALAVVDSHGEFLASFRRKARACGAETLRSNYVQHVGPSPFGLERFAETQNRGEELVPTRHSQRRPTVAVFLDHANRVIERFDLGASLHEATVTGLEPGAPMTVETTAGDIEAEHVVLATGPGAAARPSWSHDTPDVEHVWGRTEPPETRIDRGERVLVVGGGITAGQFAVSAADRASEVVVCARGGLSEALREADPRWLNWEYIEKQLHQLPAGSKRRYTRVEKARNDGTVPPYLGRELRDHPGISVRQGVVDGVVSTADGPLPVGAGFAGSTVDRVVLATGFEPAGEQSLINRVADSCSLARGHRGLPVLEDETLSWQRQDGNRSRILVTGRLAMCTVGPYAGNVPGARRAAERIVELASRERAVPSA